MSLSFILNTLGNHWWVSNKGAKVEQLLQWVKGHFGRCVSCSVTMGTKTIGPLCVRLVLGVDFLEGGIGFASHHWDASEQQDAR